MAVWASRKRFTCHESFQYYKCRSCNYSTHEKIRQKRHFCGFETDGEGAILRKCDRCNMGSFSILWYHFHKNCNSNKPLDSTFKPSQKLWHCQQCGFKTMRKSQLNKHYYKQHGLIVLHKRYQCEHCEFKSDVRATLELHRIIKHTPSHLRKQFKCDECNYVTMREKCLKTHKLFRHKTWPQCEECGFKIANSKIHKCYTTDYYQCEQCNYKTKIKRNFYRHRNATHSENQSQHDKDNIKTYKNAYNHGDSLKTHRIKINTPIEFRCDKCEFKSLYKSSLKKHIVNKHAASIHLKEKFRCDKCEFVTLDKSYLNIHRDKKHSSFELKLQFQCDKCEFVAKKKQYLNNHKLNKHEVWFKCDKCVFKSGDINHLKIHKCK